MKYLKKKSVMALAMVACLMFGNVMSVEAASARASYKRGGPLMWVRDNVDFTYNTSTKKIISSSGSQEAGWVFPNISRNKGISKISGTTTQHTYRAINVIGAGVPTPWGDVTVYESTYTHVLKVNGDGSWSAYSN